jgi:hypothetical protein
MELCPKCQKQGCKCPIKHYYLPGDRRGFKLPQTLPPKIFERRLYAVNREAGLQTFLEHRLHDHKFMANTSLSRLKELAQKFSGKRMDYETFEQVWRNTLEFKDRSDRASRECGEKFTPDKVNWSRKDREAPK